MSFVAICRSLSNDACSNADRSMIELCRSSNRILSDIADEEDSRDDFFDVVGDFSCREIFCDSWDIGIEIAVDEFDCVDVDRVDREIEIFDRIDRIDRFRSVRFHRVIDS